MLKYIRRLMNGRKRASVSTIVDPAYYYQKNPDVMLAGISAEEHYRAHGWKEGRDPSATFTTLYALIKARRHDQQRDRRPLIRLPSAGSITFKPHDRADYISLQRNICEPYFDSIFYLTQILHPYPEPLAHYLEVGWRNGLEPRADFDTEAYLARHSYVRSLDIAPFFHRCALTFLGFIADDDLVSNHAVSQAMSISPPRAGLFDVSTASGVPGWLDADVRLITENFDHAWYRRVYNDVLGDDDALIRHYIEFGAAEGRNPSRLFWTAFYLRANPEIAAAGMNPFLHYLRYGREKGKRPNPVGGNLWPPIQAPPEASWGSVANRADIAAAEVTVIMPVYKGHDETLGAIYSVLSSSQRTAFDFVVVNDGSPDHVLVDKLTELSRRGLFRLIHNIDNLGFVKSVNIGLNHARGSDVILLNSDVIVYNDWLDRLRDHARSKASVATVTPYSNNATICSYPETLANNEVAIEIGGQQLDALAKEVNAGFSVPVPTGVGFCMYITDGILRRIGDLDADMFGKGYGEENDFCLRASKAGFQNLLAEDVFVYHAGRVSFGEDLGGEFASGQAALALKHPDYEARVKRYVSGDPGRYARERLDLRRIAAHAAERPVIIVTHVWGGGIARHVDDLTAALIDDGRSVIQVSVGRSGPHSAAITLLGRESIHTPSLSEVSLRRGSSLLAEFLTWSKPEFIHFHSVVGLNWSNIEGLMNVVQASDIDYYWTLHDYSPVCHRNNLIDVFGQFCGLADTSACNLCLERDRVLLEQPRPMHRRTEFGRFLRGAKAVIAPSYDTISRFRAVYPELHYLVRPHIEQNVKARRPARPVRDYRKVAMLGAIGEHKGSALLTALAEDVRQRDLSLEYCIVGYSDRTDELWAKGVTETGDYPTDDEALRHLDTIQPDLILFASPWPETYSYTLSLGLLSGFPVVAFDLGAPAERLRDLDTGLVLTHDLLGDPRALNDALLAVDLDKLWSRRRSAVPCSYRQLDVDYFGRDRPEVPAGGSAP